MSPRLLARTDTAAAALLLLWAGMVAGFAFLTAPLLFSLVPSRDLAGLVAGQVVARLDLGAWIGFGAALVMVQGTRWAKEIRDRDAVGPIRLWGAAALLALLMCFTSSFIVTPRLRDLRARMGGTVETVAPDHPDRAAFRRAHGISRQLMGLRVLLALALAAGVAALPRE
ncbi:MAG: DUF4149 domain-containing protein [Holophaga sp.]|jgi:hypothetical protein